MRLRVVCGLGEKIAALRPTRVLTNRDLPALGRPTIATKPDLNGMKLNCTPMSGAWAGLRRRGRGSAGRDAASAHTQHLALIGFENLKANTVGIDHLAHARDMARHRIEQAGN